MKKRILALLLVVALAAFMLSACADRDGDVENLVMAMMTWVLPQDVSVVEAALNEVLGPRYGINIELLVMDAAAYQQNTGLMLASGEQIDVMSSLFAGYVNMQNQGYLLDLEEDNLLQEHGAGIVEALGGWDIVNGARIGGVLYGLPTNVDHAAGRGAFAVGTQYLEAINYPLPNPNNQIIRITIDEFDNILSQIHEAFPDLETIRPLMPGNIGHYFPIDNLGPDPFGVLIDPANDLTVTNFFASQEWRRFTDMTRSWNERGFISGDAETDDTPVTALVSSGRLMAYFTGGKPGIVAQETGLCAQPMTIFQTGPDFMAANAVARFPWVMPYTTANPEKAMTLMRAIYTDPEISNILIWGVEGTHYEVQPTGHIGFAAGVDAGTSGWFNNVAWAMPNQFIAHVWEGNDLDLAQQTINFNGNAMQSKAFGFIFNSTPVQNEIAAVTNVYTELVGSVGLGFVDPATGIAQLNERLEAAGLNRI